MASAIVTEQNIYQIGGIQTGNTAYTIVTEQRLPKLGGRGSSRRDPSSQPRLFLWRSESPHFSPLHERKPARNKIPSANFETAYWLSPRRGTIKIVEDQTLRKSSKVLKDEKARTDNQLVRLSISKPKHEDNCMSRDGPTPHLSCRNDKVGLNETCPIRGVVCNQNINGLSGKDKNLDSLLESLIDIMITKGVMVYCVQETWVVGNSLVRARGHMIFYITG